MQKKLIIVESPTKAKTLVKFLPKEYKVISSMGHIRDLPSSAAEIPSSIKKESWANLGINYLNGFTPCYVIPAGKSKIIKNLKDELKDSDLLILATDDDREGESISWHLQEILQPKVPVKRMVFHQISKKAVLESLNNFREINKNLVVAQESRRILDRLVGYTISPLLWKKITYKLSAGRVQSVAMNLIVEKEIERMNFVSAEYWDLLSLLEKNNSQFEATLITINDKKIATSKDFNPKTGKIVAKDKYLLKEKEATELKNKLQKQDWVVKQLEKKIQEQKPYDPFITSTLQQEASSKLKFSARDTMSKAQSLYEKGYITYMRTDSVQISREAITSIRNIISQQIGKEFLSKEVRVYKSKSKNAQEAHESIRPVDITLLPNNLKESIAENRLYELIWKRSVASQMTNCIKEFIHCDLVVDNCIFHTIGKKIIHKGFLTVYLTDKNDQKDQYLPELKIGEKLKCTSIKSNHRETIPPPRYSEASLIKILEKEDVGRPSTYATTISTIIARNYIKNISGVLVPTFIAFAVAKFLKENFAELIDLKFTAKMEEQLDFIATGKTDWKQYLEEFYNGKEGLLHRAEFKNKSIEAETYKKIQLPKLPELKISRYGIYIQRDNNGKIENANIQPNVMPADLNQKYIDELFKTKNKSNEIGIDPKTGLPILVMLGRYGYYLQLGLANDNFIPKKVTLPKSLKYEELELNFLLKLFTLPIKLGEHPQGGEIEIGISKYGTYISRAYEDNKKIFCSIDITKISEVSLEKAIELLKSKKSKGGQNSQVFKELGEHPIDKNKISIYKGIYGYYIKHGPTNISISKDPENITIEKAIELIESKKKNKFSKKKKK